MCFIHFLVGICLIPVASQNSTAIFDTFCTDGVVDIIILDLRDHRCEFEC